MHLIFLFQHDFYDIYPEHPIVLFPKVYEIVFDASTQQLLLESSYYADKKKKKVELDFSIVV